MASTNSVHKASADSFRKTYSNSGDKATDDSFPKAISNSVHKTAVYSIHNEMLILSTRLMPILYKAMLILFGHKIKVDTIYRQEYLQCHYSTEYTVADDK